MERNQIFVKFLDGRTRCLQIPSATVSGEALKEFVLARTGIPLRFQRLVSGLREIGNETLISASEDGIFPSCSLLLRLRGGKGGFGSLLRGAATKAGQKKTNNFDACRDMSGRRLRHVNAEKRLEEWKAEAEGRKLEKLADQFLKSKTKQVKKTSSKAAEKYIEKYKEDSAKCMEEVEESVRQSFELYQKSKRKVLPSSGPASKRLRTWLGNKKVDESDSDDEDEDEDDLDLGKSNGLDGDVMVSSVQSEQEISDGGSGKSNSAGESEISLDQKEMAASEGSVSENLSSDASLEPEKTLVEEDDSQKYHLPGPATEDQSELVGDQTVEQKPIDAEVGKDSSPEEVSTPPEKALDACVAATEDSPEQKEAAPEKKLENEKSKEQLNFEKFNSAGELEVLGMEGLKSELQARGLKCGGTLKERAARLFLLKTTPLDKLPKKLLAKPLI